MKKMIWLVLVLVVCFSGCYVGLSPVDESGFELKIKNDTYGVESIFIKIEGDFYCNGEQRSSIMFKVGYTESVSIEPKANQYISVTYYAKPTKGHYTYDLYYCEEIYIDPDGYTFEMVSPMSLEDYYGWS